MTTTTPQPRIVDSHIHLWDPHRLAYAWLEGSPLRRPFGPAELLDTAPQISEFVFVQADCAAEQGIREIDWVRHIAGDWLRGIVGFAPIEAGADVMSILDELVMRREVVGVRRLLQDEPPGFALPRKFLDGLAQVSVRQLPFDACIRRHQLDELRAVAAQLPQLTIVLDHLGKPQVNKKDWVVWQHDLNRLAAQPNVYCKLSGLFTETGGEEWSTDLIRPYLSHAIEVFGPRRCMFGSDWPVLTLGGTHEQWLEIALGVLEQYSEQDRDFVLHETAQAVYRQTERDSEAPLKMGPDEGTR
jgi:L-fuconolactonase